MSITRRNPMVAILSGGCTIVNDIPAYEAAKPGSLMELFSDGGTLKWRKNSDATKIPTIAVLGDQPERNKGYDDACDVGDLVPVHFLCAGDTFYAILPSGQDIVNGDWLGSNGDGKLKEVSAAASSGLARFQALDTLGAITEDTRCRVQFIG